MLRRLMAVGALLIPAARFATADVNAPRTVIARPAQTTIVATIPAGSRDTEVGTSTCEDCEEGSCVAGFAMSALNDDIYFYDFDKDNLKVIPIRGNGTGQVTRVIPGLPFDPADGVVLSNEVVCLLMDRWESQSEVPPRYALYWGGEGKPWHEVAVPSPVPDVSPNGVPLFRAMRVERTSDDDVYLVTSLHGMSLKVGVQGEPVAFTDSPTWTSTPILGVTAPPESPASTFIVLEGQSSVPVPARGYSLGRDREGRTYCIVPHPTGRIFSVFSAVRLDVSGAVLDAIVLPELSSKKRFAGKGGIIASASGSIVGLQVDERGQLVIGETRFE